MTVMTAIERAVIAKVMFEAVDPNDGRPPLFVWTRGDDSSSMGHERLHDAASEACADLNIA